MVEGMIRYLVTAVLVLAVLTAAIFFYRDRQVSAGQAAFARLGCSDCHLSGGGPNLAYVADKYDADTLVRFITDPELVYKQMGRKPLNAGYGIMHRVKASPSEIHQIAAYLRSLKEE